MSISSRVCSIFETPPILMPWETTLIRWTKLIDKSASVVVAFAGYSLEFKSLLVMPDLRTTEPAIARCNINKHKHTNVRITEGQLIQHFRQRKERQLNPKKPETRNKGLATANILLDDILINTDFIPELDTETGEVRLNGNGCYHCQQMHFTFAFNKFMVIGERFIGLRICVSYR